MSRNVLALALAAALLACSGGSKGISVSARTADGTPTAATALDLDNGIVLERVRLVVREVEVEGGDAGAACPGDDSAPSPAGAGVVPLHDGDDGEDDGEDCDDGLEFGPFLVDLSGAELAGGVHWAFDVPVPAGTYEELEVKVNTLPVGKAAGNAGLAEMAALHASVAVNGTIDGVPFLYTAPMEIEQEREDELVVDAETAPNLTLDVDPTGWFGGTGDARLDPRDPTDEGAIRAAIRASIRLDRDDDHDGCDDDGDDDRCDPDDDDGDDGPGDT